jgi:hypothetical protein
MSAAGIAVTVGRGARVVVAMEADGLGSGDPWVRAGAHEHNTSADRTQPTITFDVRLTETFTGPP